MQTPRSLWRSLLSALALVASQLLAQAAAGPAVSAHRSSITLPTYPWWPAVPHPNFRGTDGKNIYPYPMLDNLSREKTSRTFQTVVLENQYLRITFLPELGGKIHEVIDKSTGQPMFYVNHVVKPGLIGMCGAWTSGGVEWNTGPQGHTASAMQPVDVLILPPAQDGSRSVAVGESERIYGTKWTVVVTLRPDRAFIEERVRIYNPTLMVRPYYFWNCTAAANTPGFRFIYPMTLGCDHGSEKFFSWPIDHGKDLTRGTNYQDASSIFAWHCDQDFFGSYDDVAERGVVAYANHHQVPGKKAWTWGQGGFGKMHQMDLTDNDGPYNEVQTGPLLTQGEVGRLEPSEAVEWREWWFPVHDIGGFTFANKEVAVNASIDAGQLQLRMIGTAARKAVAVCLRDGSGAFARHAECSLSPRTQTQLVVPLAGQAAETEVQLRANDLVLAQFRVPLALPLRTRPERKPKPGTAAEIAQAGWDHFLFARFPEAEAQFRNALTKDPKSIAAHCGLALLELDRNPAAARKECEAALATNPDTGLARLTLAAASLDDDPSVALDQAWLASLDPATAAAGRTLAARILIGRRQFQDAIRALSGNDSWQADSAGRDRRALAHFLIGERETAAQLARASLEVDPLDTFALSVLWLMNATPESKRFSELVSGNVIEIIELAKSFSELKQEQLALRIMDELYLKDTPPSARDPMAVYWADFLRSRQSAPVQGDSATAGKHPGSTTAAWPYDSASVLVLRDALARKPYDGQAALLLGHVLFHLGRQMEGRELWKRAAELGASPVIAYRALGMASLTLDKDSDTAAGFLTQAHAADKGDAIVARDLARVLFTLADKTNNAARQHELWSQARDTLQSAFGSGKSRSDFVCLLGRAQNRLGEYGATTKLLDSVRITVWEGSREAHDLFEEAHLALGRAQLQSGHPQDALAEFDRALEYPENLATGRLEKPRDGHIHRLRAEALKALGRTDAAREAEEKAGPASTGVEE